MELKKTRKDATSLKAFTQAQERAIEAFRRSESLTRFLVVMVSSETLQLLWFSRPPDLENLEPRCRPESDGLFEFSIEAYSPGLRRLLVVLQWDHDCNEAVLSAAIRDLYIQLFRNTYERS